MTDFIPHHTSEIQFSLLENELHKLGCKQIQTYFPILSLLKKSDEILTSRLPNLNTVLKIYPSEKVSSEDEYEEDKDDYIDHYIKTIMSCDILNTSTNKIKKQPIFIKFIPILEPVQYAMGEFHNENGEMNKNAIDQINKYNNTAYTEVFANYILSLIVEKNKCPNFPIFYGTYSSIMEWFQYDFTQEWEEIEEIDFFQNQYEKGNIVYDFKSYNFGDSLDIMDVKNDIDLELEIVDLDKDNNEENEMEDGSSLTSDSNNNTSYWCKIKDYPTQIGFFEKLEYTIEEWIEENGNFSLKEWKSILFQIVFALSFIQTKFNMIHNDLHCDNIMFSKTDQEYLYYVVDNTVYRIPTFGRVVKIIDFARATYSIGDTILFPDVFEENGDAHGQYDVPIDNKWKRGDVTPNPSFDLVRLATTIYEYVNNEPEIMEMLMDWCKTTDNSNLLFEEDSFDLYCQIAHRCYNAVPKKQIQRNIFDEFTLNVTKDMIPFLKEQTLYNLN